MNKVDVGAYRIRPECAHLSLCMYSGVCDTPLRLIAGIPSCTLQEAFQPWDSVLHDAGSFPALGFRPARCRKLSSLGIPSCTMQGAFQPWDSVPTLWGSFRGLHFRKVSIIGGFANISAEKIGFGRRIFCLTVGLSGKNKSAGAGNGAAADSVQSSKIT